MANWFPLNIALEDGTTWTGDTSRTWTISGAGLTMEWPESPRVTLANAFEAAVSDGVQVYSSPPETVAPPAVVVRPADPYQAPATTAGGVGAAWAFDVDIIMGRTKVEQSLDELERAREMLTGALPDGYRWVEFGEIEELVVNKRPYLKATLGVAVIATEGMTRYG